MSFAQRPWCSTGSTLNPIAFTPRVQSTLLLQTVKKARPFTRDLVEHSHREVHDLPAANARFVDALHRMAFIGARTKRAERGARSSPKISAKAASPAARTKHE